jgi:DNA-binding response OmpR family regulator
MTSSSHEHTPRPRADEARPVELHALAADPVLRASLERDIEGADIRLQAFEDERELLSSVEAGRPDGVLLPAELATRPLGELVGELHATRKEDKVSVIVVGLDDRHRALAKEITGASYLEIPYGRTELIDTVQRACRRRRLIVLVDDSKLIHKHTAPVLEEAGYDVMSAMDGREGLRLVRSKRPDLLLTDIEMPELDGYELCKTVKQDMELGSTPVVICSALGEAADLERGFDAGADDYLVKPAMPEELVTRIRNLLAGLQLGGRERVLVTEDSPPVRRMVADGLGRQGFEVHTARDGKEGFEKAKELIPDLIITDYDMPRWTGFQLVHALKRDPHTRDIPVMMLTARQSKRDQAQMRAAGLTAYLVKPFSSDKCVALAERLLAERRLLDYKKASRLYLSKGTARAAEAQAASKQVGAQRAQEKVMTVLFSDLCGFTAMSSQKSPSEVVELLNEYFDRMCPIIIEEGGDIDKFIGDAIMAVFGGEGDESSAVQAVRAGLRMQKALDEWAETAKANIRSRVGINTGVLVRGDIGSVHVRRDYTVIGDTVNRAQRFESQAPTGGVLISESTFMRCQKHIVAEKREGLKLKGVAEPVVGYVVKSLREQ